MKEHFADLSDISNSSSIMSVLFPIIIATCVVLLIKRTFNAAILLTITLLSLLLYIIFTSMTSSNLAGSIDPTIYPNMPHLGLGAVSLQNKYPY
jgi:hypothetical protein